MNRLTKWVLCLLAISFPIIAQTVDSAAVNSVPLSIHFNGIYRGEQKLSLEEINQRFSTKPDAMREFNKSQALGHAALPFIILGSLTTSITTMVTLNQNAFSGEQISPAVNFIGLGFLCGAFPFVISSTVHQKRAVTLYNGQ